MAETYSVMGSITLAGGEVKKAYKLLRKVKHIGWEVSRIRNHCYTNLSKIMINVAEANVFNTSLYVKMCSPVYLVGFSQYALVIRGLVIFITVSRNSDDIVWESAQKNKTDSTTVGHATEVSIQQMYVSSNRIS